MTLTWAEFRRERRRSRQAWALLAVAALAAVAGLGWFFTAGQFAAVEPPADGPSEAPVLAAGWMDAVPSVRPVPWGPAAALLDTLPVKGRAGRDNYDRSAFGQAWLDVDRNGCDTRNDILRRDLVRRRIHRGLQLPGGRRNLPGTLHRPPAHLPPGSREQQSGADRPRRGAGGCLAKGRPAADACATRAPGERSTEPYRRRRPRQPGQKRVRRRHLAAAEQGLPLPLRRPADLRQGGLPVVGHPGGEGRDEGILASCPGQQTIVAEAQ